MKTLRTRAALAVALLVLMSGCVGTKATVPGGTAPQPPQVTALQIDRALASSANVAAALTTTLYENKQIDLATAQDVKRYLLVVAKASDDVATECQSQDPWETMRVKVGVILATATTNAAVTDTNLKAAIAGVQTLVTQILGVK